MIPKSSRATVSSSASNLRYPAGPIRRFLHFILHNSYFIILFACSLRAADSSPSSPLFPFVLPWDDATPGITDVSALNSRPAGAAGFIVAKDGHLYAGPERFRILGVNFVFGANFPTHSDAERVAARMAKFGVNCVRFHHMDNLAAPGGIWSADMKTLDPGQLDKLDYFISQLKAHGIYADLNLHVSRGYPGMPKWTGMPSFFKGVDLFYPPMVAMQRDYARQLLTHVNSYTHNAYIDEPAVALIEINNENGLIDEWTRSGLDAMPSAYRTELQSRWNNWLQAKYQTPSALQSAWNSSEEALGPEMLKNTAFDGAPGEPWIIELHDEAKASASRDGTALRITVSKADSVGWHAQLVQPGIAFSKGKHYTITFRARASGPRKISISAAQYHEPWDALWSENVELTPDWKQYQLTFRPSADDPAGRIIIGDLGIAAGDCWLSDVSLRTGGLHGLQKEEHLGAVPIFSKSEVRTDPARRDWASFLYDTENAYWTGMEQFVKQDLHAHSLILGTAAGYSPVSIQAKLDVVDAHAYWLHPHFPHKSWDSVDWVQPNLSMAGQAEGGVIPELAAHRVADKPFICTEFNAPAPNTHTSEAFLLLSAYAALQDWDGYFIFAYSHRTDDWDTRCLRGFFDLDQHPTKLVTLPAAAMMFRRGDVSPAKKTVLFPLSTAAAIDATVQSGSRWDMRQFGMDRLLPLQSRVQFVNTDEPVNMIGLWAPEALKSIRVTRPVTTSDTGELTWNAATAQVLINAPRSKAFIGKITGSIALGDVTIEPNHNMQDWAAISVTDMALAGSRPHLLITATGYVENTGMRWKSAAHDSVGRDWGTAPSLAEGIPATITLHASASVQVWALDSQGQRKTQVKVTSSQFEIGPQYQTLWYEVAQ